MNSPSQSEVASPTAVKTPSMDSEPDTTRELVELRGRIVVFSILGCSYCRRAKSRLEELRLPYHDICLDAYPDMRSEMTERTSGKTSVPQIFFNNKYLGGWDSLEAAEKSGLFQEYLDEVIDNLPPMEAIQPPVKGPDQDVQSKEGFAVDEYFQLVLDIRGSGLIGDHRYHLRNYKNSFVGKELVDWLVANKNLTRLEATNMGQQLLSRKFCHHVTDDHDFKDGFFFYRLIEDDESIALNTKFSSELEPQPASQLGETLRRAIVKLYGAFLSSDGLAVDYSSMAQSQEFENYVKLSSELMRTDVGDLSRNETLAFFINIYNALVIHGTVQFGTPTSTWQRLKFFNKVTYNISGSLYSLQDIENGVLRGNRKGVGQLRNPFGKGDPRLSSALNRCEPKIHFALVCGAKSCPAIKTYSVQNVDEELRLAAGSFLDGDAVVLEGNVVRVSRILKWYSVDFGSNKHEMLAFVYDHLPEKSEKRAPLMALLKSRTYQVEYQNYDWSANSK